eukprot:634480-Pelagomonas_calceolata.AAC.1
MQIWRSAFLSQNGYKTASEAQQRHHNLSFNDISTSDKIKEQSFQPTGGMRKGNAPVRHACTKIHLGPGSMVGHTKA